MALRIVVVDDTAVFRKIVTDALAQLPDVEVVGAASNGKIALSRIKSLKPDLITLDIEMPEMNGIEVLEELDREKSDVGVIVLSCLTRRGGDLTIKALSLGAFDYVTKPEGGTMEENKTEIRNRLLPMLKAFENHRQARKSGFRSVGAPLPAAEKPASSLTPASPKAPSVAPPPPAAPGQVQYLSTSVIGLSKTEVIAIGVSTGGPNALAQMLPKLPPSINVPVLIVQHMPPVFTQSLANSLNAKCQIRVKEAEDGETIYPNTAYIAPGGHQMKIGTGVGSESSRKIVRITDDPPENNCRPSVDYLFRSVSQVFPGKATGVIMTGMGNDGTLGLKLMKRVGARVIAQSEQTCVVYGMPKEAVAASVVDVIAPLDKIAEEIVKTLS